MANKHKGLVSIELDKKRNLRYTMNALGEIEDHLGVPLSEMSKVKMSIKNIQVMLWAGLLHEDEELTLKQVGDMVDMGNFEEVQEKIAEAFAMFKEKKSK